MKIKEGFALREVHGQGIVIATGKRALSFNGMIRLNEVGTMIWKLLEEGTELQEIARKITADYKVEERAAAEDVSALLDKLLTAGILED
jgi:hypothetical protein